MTTFVEKKALRKHRSRVSRTLAALGKLESECSLGDQARISDLLKQLAQARMEAKFHGEVNVALRQWMQDELAAVDCLLSVPCISLDDSIGTFLCSDALGRWAVPGSLMRSVVAYLVEAKGAACSATQIATYVARGRALDQQGKAFGGLRAQVVKALNRLASQHLVAARPESFEIGEATWQWTTLCSPCQSLYTLSAECSRKSAHQGHYF